MDGVMFGFIKYENLLFGASLFSIFATMYCALIYIKVDRMSKQMEQVWSLLSDDIKNIQDPLWQVHGCLLSFLNLFHHKNYFPRVWILYWIFFWQRFGNANICDMIQSITKNIAICVVIRVVLVGPAGLEPATTALWAPRSNQLNYRPYKAFT